MIDGLKAVNAGPLHTDSVAPIWREIMSACRALETPTRVAYLGPAGTFSEQAALGYFGSSIVRVPCASIDEVFRATSAGAADFGVVPVENSTEGVVARSLDLFLHTPLFIIGETSLFVRHNLLRRRDLARRHRPRSGASAGAGAMPRLAQPATCPTSSAGRWRATPKARAWPAWTPRWPRIASERAGERVRPARGRRRRSRTTPTTAPASPSSRTRDRHPAPQAVGPRLHQPGGVGDEPARGRARHAGAAEAAWRVDDTLRVAPGALRPVGVLLLHRHRRATPTSRRWRRR